MKRARPRTFDGSSTSSPARHPLGRRRTRILYPRPPPPPLRSLKAARMREVRKKSRTPRNRASLLARRVTKRIRFRRRHRGRISKRRKHLRRVLTEKESWTTLRRSWGVFTSSFLCLISLRLFNVTSLALFPFLRACIYMR